ncbi:MAG: c-type cytochrome [Bdellovibrionaceae bacterium]|nr:c-type cytochrome [Pseudobdellovibrionaceae bacterium]MDW8191220.1 c-type cytochrome [Pseudobdellovibrionaceae bacterium]
MNQGIKTLVLLLLSSAWAIALFAIYKGKTAYEKLAPISLPSINWEQLQHEPNRDEIVKGKKLLEKTYEMLPDKVGAKISCTNCHLNAGTKANAGPWIGIIHRFPQYRDRSGKYDTLTDRINDCFERSLNGQRLPEDDPNLKAILAYMEWLSRPVLPHQKLKGIGMPRLALNREPNWERGKEWYMQKCASCHQKDGQGLIDPSTQSYRFPPLWGPNSFNIGAGMARLHTAAGFIKHNMPQGQEGTLSDDEAFDIAYFFSHQERPDFAKKHLDWPKGNKPKDARY